MKAGIPVGHHTYSSTTVDGYGRDVPAYTPAKTAAGRPVAVYGWANPSGSEPKLAGHERVVVEVELYAPPDFTPGPHDLIDLPSGPLAGQFEVIGYPEDWTHGPFGFAPGYVINLKRAEG